MSRCTVLLMSNLQILCELFYCVEMHKASDCADMNLCAWQESNLTCAVGRYRNRRIISTVIKRFYVRKYLYSNSVNVRNMCELYLQGSLTARPIAGCQRGSVMRRVQATNAHVGLLYDFYLNNGLKNIQHSTAKV